MRTTLGLTAAIAVTLSACCNTSLKGEGDGGSDGGTGGPLVFAIVGDTRPGNPCPSISNCPYPTEINTIYKDLTEFSPVPSLVVGTGDYMYNEPGAGTAVWQVQQYLAAAQIFTGPIYLGMGNHECTGYTDSECGADNSDGVTENFTAYLQTLLAGLKVNTTVPYYVETVAAGEGQTAKFVFTAANAWDSTQSAWLSTTLAVPSTYTFVIRHEPTSDARDCPGITPIDTILAGFPLTMKIVGHTHEYRPYSSSLQEVLVGNGGAPLDGGDYGFVICKQRTDNAIQCDDYDYLSNAPINDGFALTPTGSVTAVQ